MEKVRDEVVANIRACLVSTQGQIPLRQLERDYRTLLGERIPYGKLGHQKLEDFLASVPTILLTKSKGGEVFVDAAPSNKSSHISEMVMKQKTTSSKKRLKPRNVRYTRPTTGGYYQPAVTTAPSSPWRPRFAPQTSKGGSPRAAAVSHNQFVQKRHRPTENKTTITNSSPFSNLPPRLQTTSISDRLNVHRDAAVSTAPAVSGITSSSSRLNGASVEDVGNGVVSYQSRTSFDMTGMSGFIKSLAPLADDSGGGGGAGAGGTGGVVEGSALTSAKRRIAKKMSEMSLECDSGTSSPTTDIGPLKSPTAALTAAVTPPAPAAAAAALAVGVGDFLIEQKSPEPVRPTYNGDFVSAKLEPPIVEFVRTGHDLDDLKRFVKLNNLGELETKISEIKGKKYKPTLYHCVIKVGSQHSYSSYPRDFSSQADAEAYCASQALDDLMERYKPGQQTKGPLLLSVNEDILSRVPPMLERHQHGIWSWQLEEDYAALYGEHLPSNWLVVVDTSDCVSIEKVLDKYVLRHCTPGKVFQKGQLGQSTLDIGDVSVASNTVQFGEDGRLVAQITCVISVNEIWCCQCDTTEFEAFSDAMAQMETYYSVHWKELAVSGAQVHTNSFCVARIDDSWYRVKVFEVLGEEASCFLIDYGEICSVSCLELFQLKREYAALQAQAFICRLIGLEELNEVSVSSKDLQGILYKEVILEAPIDELGNISSEKNIPVVMYDANDPSKCLNEELIRVLASPKLDQDGGITEVVVSHVESNGDVYVQVPGPGLDVVRELERRLADADMDGRSGASVGPDCGPERLFLHRRAQTEGGGGVEGAEGSGRWRRVRLIDWSPRGDLAQTYCVDVGSTDVIRPAAETLHPLDRAAGDWLGVYPDQALRVRLHQLDDEVPPDFVDAMQRLLPVGGRALLKTVADERADAAPPLVEFFKRSVEGGLFCINKSIAIDQQMKKNKDKEDKENKQQQQQKLQKQQQQRKLPTFTDVTNKNVPSGGCLQAPSYPQDSSEYFNVMVPFAVNPWNFVVQPLDSSNQLKRLMADMQERYQHAQFSPLQVEEVRPGTIYASRHEDGIWYRTCVLKVIHSGSISVFYCDFGYYANLSVHQLLPIEPDLLELPYQALKARLHGIKPKHQKWTMDDCTVFKEMVRQKAFVSVVMDVNNDELHMSDVVLELMLIDTTTESDQYVHKELIMQDIAVPTED